MDGCSALHAQRIEATRTLFRNRHLQLYDEEGTLRGRTDGKDRRKEKGLKRAEDSLRSGPVRRIERLGAIVRESKSKGFEFTGRP